ncbi:MAG: ribonuclease J [Alphaproteobacteria bacterium]|nr:ribonuclease J [Alphaproteobacteria bacterium]
MTQDKDGLIFLPLGGAGEIGMNLNLYGYGGKWLIVDLGVSFGDDTMPSIDVFMADPAFIADRRQDLVGIVVTHGHEDHLGAIGHLWKRLRCPVYASPFAADLLHGKLQEAGIAGQVPVTVVPLGGRFTAGPFDVELVTLTHSIPEPNALAIRTPAGLVLHTGDWKLDPDPQVGKVADETRLRELGDEGVLAVMGDSTNVFTEGWSGSEADVRANLIPLIGRFQRRVAVTCFATNVARVKSIAAAAFANGREVALVGRSLWRIDAAARKNGYLKGTPAFLNEHDAGYLPEDKVLYICTGSQGEPRAALSRIATDQHPHVTLGRGDVTIFSSRIIPGNEKAIGQLQNMLARLGVEVVTERDEFVHVSGHPARDELARMYQLVRPRILVPVHGERRHLEEHARLALSCQVAHAPVIENGAMLLLSEDGPEVIDHVPTGRLALDGNRLVRLDSAIMRDRHRMIANGSAVVTLVIDRMGRLLADPQVTAMGILDAEHEAREHEAVVDAVRDAIEEMPLQARRDDAVLREAARLAVRRHLKTTLGKKPVTDVHLIRV